LYETKSYPFFLLQVILQPACTVFSTTNIRRNPAMNFYLTGEWGDMVRKLPGYFLIFLLTACQAPVIEISRNPAVNFNLKDKPAIVVLLASRNFSGHNEIDLQHLDRQLLDKLNKLFIHGRFLSIAMLKKNISNTEDRETIDNFVDRFEKTGTLKNDKVQQVSRILKADYFLTPNFGANVGSGYSKLWVATANIQFYDGNSGTTAFSVNAERSEPGITGFDLERSDLNHLFESVLNDALGTIP
jgi:hypothetical protein